MADTTVHFIGKTLFSKLDCSQAYHYVQMANRPSVQLVAFIFAFKNHGQSTTS